MHVKYWYLSLNENACSKTNTSRQTWGSAESLKRTRLSVRSYVFVLIIVKNLQLSWAAARGRCNDVMIRLWVHTRYSQFPRVGLLFASLSTRHRLASCLMWLTRLLRFCCWRPFENLGVPTLGSNPGPLAQQVNNFTINSLSCLRCMEGNISLHML